MSRVFSFLVFVVMTGAASWAAAKGIYLTDTEAPADKLHRLVEEYRDEYLALDPIVATRIGDHRFDGRLPDVLTAAGRATAMALERRYLTEVATIPSGRLSDEDRLSQEIFLLDRRNRVESLGTADRYLPLSQFDSVALDMAEFGSGGGPQPFKTAKDFDAWSRRCEAFSVWVDNAIANMREGARSGITLPRAVVVRILKQLEILADEDNGTTHFLAPLRTSSRQILARDRARLEQSLRAAVSSQLIPAYQRLQRFLRDGYLPVARESLGLSSIPGGNIWYEFLVRRETTTRLSPEEVHDIGLREVTRISQEMSQIARSLGSQESYLEFMRRLNEDPTTYFDRSEELLGRYREVGRIVEREIGRFFAIRPKSGLEIREIEQYRAPSVTAAYYEPAPADGSRSAVFYVNTHGLDRRPKYSIEPLFLHEAEPGHHLQVSLQMENEGLPRFRRFGGNTAYGEGWALYAESLGGELGLYRDAIAKFGALLNELLRAARLVVDTGIHLKGWSREEAIRYHVEQIGLPPDTAADEVDRYAAMPAQALAYKVGELELRALRREAEASLGARFDIREFHNRVLADGSVPLSILRSRIEEWIKGSSMTAAGP